MKEFLQIIEKSNIFCGVDNALEVLSCLDAKLKTYEKDTFILHSGETTNYLGLVVAGSALVVQEDFWGNRNIVSKVGIGKTFAVTFACAKAPLNVDVVAESTTTVVFLNANKIMSTCPNSCEHHNKIIRNILGELVRKNLFMNEKITHISQRSTRAKIMSFLSAEAQKHGNCFDVEYSRQELSDYLGVERSGLSVELSKMQNEGLIKFRKNHFELIKTENE